MKKTFIKTALVITFIAGFLFVASNSQAAKTVHYDDFEISQLLNQSTSKQLSTSYIQSYFSSPDPDAVIADLFKVDMTPLKREYVLYNLLTEISQLPPQDFHHNFIDLMKTYQIRATRTADEGHQPTAVFNLNSKAFGIENIWTAYRTEQRFNQLFAKDTERAVNVIKNILTEDSSSRRPQWLGIKNSLDTISTQSMIQLTDHLLAIKTNAGLGYLTSHVALKTAHMGLIDQALSSDLSEVRQFTLRNLFTHLPPEQVKSLLLQNAKAGAEPNFSTSLLSQFATDNKVESFLIDQLSLKKTAANAAFALSQSKSQRLPNLLKKRYLLTQNDTEKNYLLLTLKLNKSNAAQLALDDLMQYIEKDSTSDQWLKSFEPNTNGGES